MPQKESHRAVAVSLKTSDALRAEMQQILHLAAEPLRPHDNAKSRLARAAVALRLAPRRAYALWYGEERMLIRVEEAARLRAEKVRLYQLRLVRLRREIAETERLLGVQRSELVEADKAAARRAVQPNCQLVLPLGKPA
jgi:hypothetical protein